MELSSLARIGKGILSKAIGLQKNYKEILVNTGSVIDRTATGCHRCPYYMPSSTVSDTLDRFISSSDPVCAQCSQAVYKTTRKVRTVYINEKNKYGYQPTLKCTSIKLLILYHFAQPDENGIIKNINIKEIAKYLGCTVPTVRSCNKILQQYGYCYISNSGIYDNCINILLPEYKNYHKTAAEGGRGYITMSSDMLYSLLSIKYLMPLRLNIKGILEVDNARLTGADSTCVISTYKRLRGFLPKYCKNNVIRAALKNNSSDIFETSFTNNAVSFVIKDSFAPVKLREELLSYNKTQIIDYVSDINDNLEMLSFSINKSDPEKIDKYKSILSEQGIQIVKETPYISLNQSDYRDLAALSVQYNIHMVMTAIKQIYNNYIVHRHPIDNFGALARTFIRNSNHSLIAA